MTHDLVSSTKCKEKKKHRKNIQIKRLERTSVNYSVWDLDSDSNKPEKSTEM